MRFVEEDGVIPRGSKIIIHEGRWAFIPQEANMPKTHLPQDAAARKQAPMARGLLDYFPAALFEVARHSFLGNAKHNPGQELHHARGKSMDHADCIVRHVVERGGSEDIVIDGVTYKVRHSAALAWRALALLQQEMEDEGALPARAAKFPVGGATPFGNQ